MKRTWLIAGAIAAVAAVVLAGVALFVDSDDETEPTQHAARAVTPTQALPTTLPPPVPTTVAPTAPPTAPPAPPSTGDDRLSSNSRLGYAGLGPIKLGMTYADVERVGQVTIREFECGSIGFDLHAGSGLDPILGRYGGYTSGIGAMAAFPVTNPRVIDLISVSHPAISTISGIHVGSTADDVLRTYANVDAPPPGQSAPGQTIQILTITNPEGRAVQFIAENGIVVQFSVGLSQKAMEDHRLC